ncbi:hypothetical protein E2C01_031438 [Portunus trituberculatus]|uniref:Uncharacterized protein n=1 Tax=Portunus trituberculatus TaxID=210409 RepID=A0A5B7EYJ9_PORTR|nr:hypothetical protein [Portunus trituberculatus]
MFELGWRTLGTVLLGQYSKDLRLPRETWNCSDSLGYGSSLLLILSDSLRATLDEASGVTSREARQGRHFAI